MRPKSPINSGEHKISSIGYVPDRNGPLGPHHNPDDYTRHPDSTSTLPQMPTVHRFPVPASADHYSILQLSPTSDECYFSAVVSVLRSHCSQPPASSSYV